MKLNSSPRLLLSIIVAVYVVIGALYATFTPLWQVPDEPAHYNYVRALAEGRGFPVIEPGDYDAAYLEQLKAEHFPPQLSIAPVEYEDHQPPLYYLLAAPVYLLFGGAVLPLRLLSVLIGAALLAVVFGAVQALFPRRPDWALMAVAFVAFIPQHVAMSAGVENDGLAELVMGGVLWALLLYAGGRWRRPWPVGLLLGMALLTKMTVYAALGVAGVAVLLRRQQERRTWRWAAEQLAWTFLPALLLAAPWFVRNGLTYGWLDLTGSAHHNAVVTGQMRSTDYLALHGWGGLLDRMVRWTFQSFWGQFGWMGVPLPARFYQALALLSALLAAGFLWWLCDRRRPRLTSFQRAGSLLFLAAFLLVLLEYLGYNLTFLQHQGRYLFPALVPLGTAVALGVSRWADILPRRTRPWVEGAFFAGLALFDVYCLFRIIVPALR